MKQYEVILLDADGTLFDFHAAQTLALEDVCAWVGLRCDTAVLALFRQINAGVWAMAERGQISKEALQPLRFARLLDALHLSGDAAAMNERFLAALGQHGILMDGALELCRDLSRTHRLYIITNGIQSVQQARLRHSPIAPYIRAQFISEEIGYVKPHPAYFAYVLAHIPPAAKQKILVVGDSLSADIQGGINAGLDTCWFNPPVGGGNSDGNGGSNSGNNGNSGDNNDGSDGSSGGGGNSDGNYDHSYDRSNDDNSNNDDGSGDNNDGNSDDSNDGSDGSSGGNNDGSGGGSSNNNSGAPMPRPTYKIRRLSDLKFLV